MSYSFDETYVVYSERYHCARKAHECEACESAIRPGDFYCRVVAIGKHSGATAYKRCGACQRTHEHLRTLAPGEMWPDERLACGLNYAEEWHEEPPDAIAALPLLSADERGQLLASPRVRKPREPFKHARREQLTRLA